ncbi:hypothetical protein TNCV_4834511 [Trichonephila clavipes]|nr:hypothetical protein TNCV_4834511 [Trichonephila clavipes]
MKSSYIQGDSQPNRKTCRVCVGSSEMTRNHVGMQGHSNALVSSYGTTKQRKRTQKQQHINGPKNVLLNGCSSRCFRSYDQKSFSQTDNGLLLENSNLNYFLPDIRPPPHYQVSSSFAVDSK